MTKRRLWLILVLFLCLVAVCGAAQSGTAPSKRRATQSRARPPRSPDERLIIRRGKVLHDLWRDSSTGKWQERKLVDFSRYSGREYDWSGPLVSTSGTVLVSWSRALPDVRDANQEVTLYAWRQGQQTPNQLAQFRVNAGASGGSVLDCWVQPEKLVSFAVPICEGLADWYPARITPDGKVVLRDAADDSGKRLLKALGPNRYIAPQTYSRDGTFFAASSGKDLGIYFRHSRKLRFIGIPAMFWCMSFSPDRKAIAWIGEVQPREHPWPKGLSIDYIPELNAIGIVWLKSGKTTVWRIDGLSGYKEYGVWNDQPVARVRISANKRYLYAPWGEDLARFDMKARRMTVIAKDVDGFDVVYREDPRCERPAGMRRHPVPQAERGRRRWRGSVRKRVGGGGG